MIGSSSGWVLAGSWLGPTMSRFYGMVLSLYRRGWVCYTRFWVILGWLLGFVS